MRRKRHRRKPSQRLITLVNRQLQGSGPPVTISGTVPLPFNITVSITAGILGVALVSVNANGQSLLSNVLSAASLLLAGLGTLSLSVGLYLGNSYTLVVP